MFIGFKRNIFYIFAIYYVFDIEKDSHTNQNMSKNVQNSLYRCIYMYMFM